MYYSFFLLSANGFNIEVKSKRPYKTITDASPLDFVSTLSQTFDIWYSLATIPQATRMNVKDEQDEMS
jgi:hypothetical protein